MNGTGAALLNAHAKAFTPNEEYLGEVRMRRSVIEHLLGESHAASLLETGSLTHGTGIGGVSDADYFVRLPGGEKPAAQQILAAIRKALITRYPTTRIRVSRPTVKLTFSKGADIELTPAYPTLAGDTYWIPDPLGSGGWIQSAPVSNMQFVNNVQRAQPETKKVARLLKLWKVRRNVPATSFYLEMRAARYFDEAAEFRGIDTALRYIFSSMHEDRMAPILEPGLPGDFIHASSTPARRALAVSIARQAAANALLGVVADASGNDSSCRRHWNSIVG